SDNRRIDLRTVDCDRAWILEVARECDGFAYALRARTSDAAVAAPAAMFRVGRKVYVDAVGVRRTRVRKDRDRSSVVGAGAGRVELRAELTPVSGVLGVGVGLLAASRVGGERRQQERADDRGTKPVKPHVPMLSLSSAQKKCPREGAGGAA